MENAIQRQIDADKQLQSANDQLDTQKNTLHDLQAQQESLNAQLTEGAAELIRMNSSLAEFKIQQKIIVDISEQIKKAILHIETVLSTATSE